MIGLLPAFITTGERDPLRDKREAYVRALATAGVATTHRRIPGRIHAFLQVHGSIATADTVMLALAIWLDSLDPADRLHSC